MSLILIAWFVDMPLWLSILTTCVAASRMMYITVKVYVKVAIENDLD